MAFYRFTLVFCLYIYFFQDLSENHPGERVSWIKIIVIINVFIPFHAKRLLLQKEMNILIDNVPFTRVPQTNEHMLLILFHEVLFMYFDGQLLSTIWQ